MTEAALSTGIPFDAAVLDIEDSPRLTDNVYRVVRQAIIDGRLPAGTRLSVPALSRRLGVSRSPVREAVARLTTDRLAVESPRRGAVVAAVSTRELVDLYYAREVLEGVATRLATQRCDAALRKQLGEIMEGHRAAVADGDTDARVHYDSQFHRTIADGSHNEPVSDWLRQMQARIQVAMLTTSVSAGVHLALADHERIYQAVISGEPGPAEAAARDHIVRLRVALDSASRS